MFTLEAILLRETLEAIGLASFALKGRHRSVAEIVFRASVDA